VIVDLMGRPRKRWAQVALGDAGSRMAIYLGGILGGPEQLEKPFDRKIRAFWRRLEPKQKDLIEASDALLNVVFQFSGSLFRPDFVGFQVGRFIKKEKRLEIRVAVPPDDIISDEFLIRYVSLLKEAIARGKSVFDKKQVQFSLQDHIALVEKSLRGCLESRLSVTAAVV
jgi:hypothetical protein